VFVGSVVFVRSPEAAYGLGTREFDGNGCIHRCWFEAYAIKQTSCTLNRRAIESPTPHRFNHLAPGRGASVATPPASPGKALQMLMTGEPISAQEAYRL